MEYISTTVLSNELNVPTNELFNKLKTLGWIDRSNDKWILTEVGKQKGGQTRNNPKFGEYIVWPENITISEGNTYEKSKLLTSTVIGKHFNITNQRMNLILSELGYIERAFIGQDSNGWTATKLGKSIGGKQLESENGSTYVVWPGSILNNKSLIEVFNFNQIEKAIPKAIPTPSQGKVINVSEPQADYREKFEARHRTLDGHYVRSRAEVIIDNILYQYGLVHAYERKIIIGDEEVLSDFYLPAGKVYIEFWGMESDPKYAERQKKKIDFYQKNEIPLIQLNDNDILSLDDHLPRKLKNYGIKVY